MINLNDGRTPRTSLKDTKMHSLPLATTQSLNKPKRYLWLKNVHSNFKSLEKMKR
uniref:Uncharacterized protein n=1 Tax=Rhizophagus irregularis (strain DAOM 181602 / DAOM 197198 / MUCL 43194) TaxID=747089 RepID=U9UHL3_RHIID